MKMATQLRFSHWIALAAAGAVAFYGAQRLAAPEAAGEIAEPVRRAEPGPMGAAIARAAANEPAPLPVVAAPARAAIEVTGSTDAFRSRSWLAPPAPAPLPAPVRPAPPPAPTAPSLPFKFVGMLEQKTDRPTAFLAKGEALHVVRVGDVVDGAYRVESLSATQIVVTYLPLNERQTLSVAGGQP
jgi:hypothetical protein